MDETDARPKLFACIEGYSNTPRCHGSPAYQIPASFEASLTNKNQSNYRSKYPWHLIPAMSARPEKYP